MDIQPIDHLSITSFLESLEKEHSSTHNQLARVTEAPPDFPCIGRFYGGVRKALASVLPLFDKTPDASHLRFYHSLQAIEQALHIATEKTSGEDIQTSLEQRLQKHELYATFIEGTELPSDSPQLKALGMMLMREIYGLGITRHHTHCLRKGWSLPLDSRTVDAALSFNSIERDDKPAWIKQLHKNWIMVAQTINKPRPQIAESKAPFTVSATKHFEAKAAYAAPRHRAGMFSDRHLSEGQCVAAAKQVCKWLANGDPLGAIAVLLPMSGLTVNLLKQVPLGPPFSQDPDWIFCYEPDTGLMHTNMQWLMNGAAGQMMHADGIESSDLTKVVPVPKAVREITKIAGRNYPDAKTMGELLPMLMSIDSRSALYPTLQEIVPSWSRWSRSLGHAARRIKLDTLITALLSNDFGHVPRSKIFYARVSTLELFQSASRIYSHFGWGAPVDLDCPADAGIGCRVVPTTGLLESVDIWLSDKVKQSAPPRRTTLQTLLEYHHWLVRLTGYRLMLLMALRRRSNLTLQSSHFSSAESFVVDDKSVGNMEGGLPVPTCPETRHVVSAWINHCDWLRARLTKLGIGQQEFANHLRQIATHKDIALLIDSYDGITVKPFGTQMLLDTLKPQYALPPDFGRKFFENALRLRHLNGYDTDSMLRHEVAGQERFASIADFQPGSWTRRLTPHISALAAELFNTNQSNQMQGGVE